MAPTIVGVGALASGAAGQSVPYPTGTQANDIALVIAECEGSIAPGGYTAPSGWANVGPNGNLSSPVIQGTDTRLYVFWRRLTGGDAVPAFADAGDHNLLQMIALRGCPTVGNPWNVGSVVSEAVSDTSAAWPTVTTTQADTRVLLIASTSADIGSAQTTAITGTHSLTGLTKHVDAAIITGNGGVIICWSGVMAAAANIGNPTATLTTAGFKSFITMAMANAPTAPSSAIQPRRTRNHPSFRR